MITMESIIEKLGFNPLRYEYCTKGHEDDNWENLFEGLSDEELEFLIEAAHNDPECWIKPDPTKATYE